jgi:hypothetical protein
MDKVELLDALREHLAVEVTIERRRGEENVNVALVWRERGEGGNRSTLISEDYVQLPKSDE